MLIGYQLDSGMIIMRGMGSQVSCFFDVAAAWRQCWMVVTYAGSPLGSMEQLKFNSCGDVLMLQKNEFYIINQ